MWDNHMKTLDYFDNYHSQECHALLRKQKPLQFYRMSSHYFLRMHIPPKAPDIYMSMDNNYYLCNITIDVSFTNRKQLSISSIYIPPLSHAQIIDNLRILSCFPQIKLYDIFSTLDIKSSGTGNIQTTKHNCENFVINLTQRYNYFIYILQIFIFEQPFLYLTFFICKA